MAAAERATDAGGPHMAAEAGKFSSALVPLGLTVFLVFDLGFCTLSIRSVGCRRMAGNNGLHAGRNLA